MEVIEKDILTIESGYIFQQVNCQKVMGSGLALSIVQKWPQVYTEYLTYSEKFEYDYDLLGNCNHINVTPNLTIVNMFAQLHYGYDGKRYTDYCAFSECLKAYGDCRKNFYYFPWRIGCCRGGGNWNIIIKMIERWYPEAVICRLPQSS